MGCGACGPTSNVAEMNMYRALEKKVLADEEEKKQKERERRVSLGMPAEGKAPHLFRCIAGRQTQASRVLPQQA